MSLVMNSLPKRLIDQQEGQISKQNSCPGFERTVSSKTVYLTIFRFIYLLNFIYLFFSLALSRSLSLSPLLNIGKCASY
jgi:hypothetical protein